jgi:cytochrome c556
MIGTGFGPQADTPTDKEGTLRFRLYAAAALVAWSGALVVAQKVTTPEELDKVMKKAGPAMQAANKALQSGAYADVKTQLATLKQAINDSREFWVTQKKEDALKFNKETVAKIEAVEQLVSAGTVDAAAATAALKEIGGACRSCHEPYRARDAENNYIIKPGSLGGN